MRILLGDLLAGLHVDFAGATIGEIFGDVVTDELVVGHAQRLKPLLGELTGLAHGELVACLDNGAAGVGVDQVVDRFVALQPVGIEGHAPAFFLTLVGDMLVERRKNLLAVEAERIEQRRHRNLAAAVDTGKDDVFRVELDV